MKERGWYIIRWTTSRDFFDVFQKEGENDMDGYVESEPPLIRNLDGNCEIDLDNSIDGYEHGNDCSDSNEGGDATDDGEDEDDENVCGFYIIVLGYVIFNELILIIQLRESSYVKLSLLNYGIKHSPSYD